MFEIWAPALIALACALVAGVLLGMPGSIWPDKYRPNGWIVESFLVLSVGFCALFSHEVDQFLFEEQITCMSQRDTVCVRYSAADSMAAGVLLLIASLVLFFLSWGYAWVTGKLIFLIERRKSASGVSGKKHKFTPTKF